jgi:hypothetical protein
METLSYNISDVISLSNDFKDKLSVLDGLKEYQKLILSNDSLKVDTNFSFVQPITRWWTNNSRQKTVEILEEEINTYLNFLTFIYGAYNDENTTENEKNKLMQLYTSHSELHNNYIQGLQCLKVTYSNDDSLLSSITNMIEHLNYTLKIN